ncbi:MAG: NADH:flavin oxidoreductase [Armatimonadetes bacterium]|nr:NADH:flavin oxidoreductase [Armatimonadota bacterium]
MNFTPIGRLKTIEAFRDYLYECDPELGCDLELEGREGPLGQSLDIVAADGTTRTVGNRFCVQPMEGWDATADGAPTDHMLRRWRRFGESGAKLIWGCEAFAVQRDGRANPNQLFLNPEADTRAVLAGLLGELRSAHEAAFGTTGELVVGLQLTHSGRFSRPDGPMAPLIAENNPLLAAKYDLPKETHVLTDDELRAIRDRMIKAACVAADAGFDFVDVKACHGYLVHELLGARTRTGDYGGSFENRTRFFKEVVTGIRRERPGLIIGCRVSITDLPPFVEETGTRLGTPMNFEEHLPWSHGFGVQKDDPMRPDWSEPVAFLELARSLGVSMVNLTVGSPYYCPHFQRPAAYPPSDGYLPPRDPLLEVARHLRTVREIKARVPGLPLVGSGYSYLQDWLPYVAQSVVRNGHVDFVGLGRSTLTYHDLPADVLAGRELKRKRFCRTFSDCTTGPRTGKISGCFPLDPYYNQMPESKEIKAIRMAASKARSQTDE